jgi:hypothetical protein
MIFYIFCTIGMVSTLAMVTVYVKDKEFEKVVIFDVNRGELFIGNDVIASYRKGSRNYQIMKFLYKRQGEHVSFDDIRNELSLCEDNISLIKYFKNLRVTDSVLRIESDDRSLMLKLASK